MTTTRQENLFEELKRRGLATRMSGSGFYNPTFGRFSQAEGRRQLALYCTHGRLVRTTDPDGVAIHVDDQTICIARRTS